MWALLILLAVVGIWLTIIGLMKVRGLNRRQLVLERPFPDEWSKILKRNLPPYEKLPSSLRGELHQDVKIFLAEKSFEGCGGLDLNDEIKVTIAAQACLLLLNRREKCYPRLHTIIVYPSTYVAGGKGLFGSKTESLSTRLGESWQSGAVVLAWSSVKHGAFNFNDGKNVTMHEFAHQLDQADGSADGAPILERRSAYSAWAKVFSREFSRLQERASKGKRSVLDDYGTINPAEFFAVATETFFEKPRQLKKTHPELFAQLKDYYKVDPIEWI
jgi:Mlc titration factor MtfA (ptsG expression regulator)